MTRRSDPHVLVVEEWAHRPEGHYPVLFADLAEGLIDAGYEVDVLVQRGWVHADDWGLPVRFTLHRYRWLGRWVSRAGGVLGAASSETRSGRLLRSIGSMIRGVVVTREVRAFERRLGRRVDVVVATSAILDPLPIVAFGGRRSWLVCKYRPPPRRVPVASSVIGAFARRSEARRRRSGQRVAVVTAAAACTAQWAQRLPFLRVTTSWLAASAPRAAVPDARARLGLGLDERVALVFGATHELKDTGVVWRSFADLPGWRLVVGGRLAEGLPTRPHTSAFPVAPVLVPGHVGTDCRDLLYSAADLVVLSFQPDTAADSGTLGDAIARGIPVVCSARSTAAAVVTEHRLGVLFEPGDEVSLRDAVRAAPQRITPGDLEGARAACSPTAVAQRLLAALGPD